MSNESVIPTPSTPDVCTAALLIDGEEISGEFHVLSILVVRELNRIPLAVIYLQDGESSKATFKASNTGHFIPGKKIEIQLGYRSKNDTVFKGIIIKHSIQIRKSGSVLMMECRDEAIKMTSGSNSRYFIGKKDSEIMEDLIASYQLKKEVETTKPKLKEIVQYESTDWDFLLCRAEANGQIVMVEDGSVKIARPAIDAKPAVTVKYGATVLELDAEIDARWQSASIKAHSWNASDQKIIDAEAKEPPSLKSGNLTPQRLASVMKEDPHQIRHGGKLSQAELQAWADSRLLKERLAKVRGRVRFQGFAGVLPGKLIEVTGIGERFEGKMYVSGVRHTLSNGNWETDVQFGLNPELFAETFNLRPLPAAGLLPAVNGLQTGVVTVLENDPDGEDRIKVRLPLVSDKEEGIWARVATLDAGKERGTFFRPEIGDEVVVGFLGDDPRYPVILGMCHSSAKPVPEAAKNSNHHKGYISREKMKLTFDDEKKVIVIETPGGNRITLSEEDKGILMEDQNGNKITLDDSGIRIESIKDLVLKAAKDIKIEGMNADIKAQMALKASGTSSVEVSGAKTSIIGNAATEIKGGIVQIN
jgi:Rhs element Vgr protein